MARKPTIQDAIIITEHIDIPIRMLKDIGEQLAKYKGTSKVKMSSVIADMESFTKLYEFHLKYTTEYMRLTGILEYYKKSQAEAKKLREGSRIPTVMDFVSNEALLVEAMQTALKAINQDLPESIFTEIQEKKKVGRPKGSTKTEKSKDDLGESTDDETID